MGESWTRAQNALFEDALALYDRDAPDFFQNVARAVGGGKSAEDARRHFAELERDVNHIARTGHTGQDGGSGSGNSRGESSRGSSSGDQRRLRIQ